MTPRSWIRCAGLLGALGVAAGAFGAHGLAPLLEELGTTATFETGARYHLLHALALLGCGLAGAHRAAGWCLLIGTLVFSGTLYAIALGAPRWLGAVTPAGGVLLIAGWLLLCLSVDRAAGSRS